MRRANVQRHVLAEFVFVFLAEHLNHSNAATALATPELMPEKIDSAMNRRIRAQARIADALRGAANVTLAAMRRCLWPFAQPRDIRSVCIYRIGNIGDIACAIPAMHAIRRTYPRAKLVLVTSPGANGMPGAVDILRGARWIDEIVAYHSDEIAGLRAQMRWIRGMRARRFDAWVELSPVDAPMRTIVRNMIAARMAGARWGFGWRYDRIRIFAQAQSDAIDFPNEVQRTCRIVESAGYPAPDRNEFPLDLGDAERRAIDALFAAEKLRAGPIAALAPGAKASPNRWPAERFIEVGRKLAADGFRIVVTGAAGDRELCGSIARAIGPAAVNIAGRTSVRESCEMLRRCAMLICNDSGVQHLAAAVGTPCVSIFSCRDFRGKWYPQGVRNVVLRERVDCHTCFRDQCPFDNRCIGLITADDVLSAADRILRGAASEPSSPEHLRSGTGWS